MAVIHISEAEAVRDFAAVMARIRSGAEIVIEDNNHAVAVIHPPVRKPGILLSEAIARAEAREKGLLERRSIEESIALLPKHSTAVIDEDFARDVQAAIDMHRDPLDPPEWD